MNDLYNKKMEVDDEVYINPYKNDITSTVM